jgi:ribosomal protein S12 methylthiotransferase accessory factor
VAPGGTLTTAAAGLASIVSPYTGIVHRVAELMHLPDDARLHRLSCVGADLAALFGREARFRCGGSHASRDRALAAGLGETAERYSASYLPEHEFVLATAAELGAEAVDPERFRFFRDDQYASPGFPFRPFRRSTELRWVRGFSIPDGAPAYLPVQLVYLPWQPEAWTKEPPIAYSTSSGLACAGTLEEAILRGLLELVERDAFAITWYAGLSLPLLDWRSAPALAAHERRYFAPTRLHYAAVDLSRFLGVPTVLGVVRGGSDDPAALGVGAASAATVEEAWARALSEAFAVRSWARSMRLEWPERSFDPSFGDVTTFDDHVLLYGDPAHAAHAAFLDSSAEIADVFDVAPLPGVDVRDRIEALAERLATAGASAYAVEVTAPDVREAGVSVVRVVCPELCPLDAIHDARFLGLRRLYEVPFELGLKPRPLRAEELNPYPHPFP